MAAYLEVIGVALVLAIAQALRYLLGKRLCRAMEREAKRLRLSFIEVAKPFERDFSELANLVAADSSDQVENLVQGTVCGRQMLAFSLRTDSSLGEGTTVTVFAAFESSDIELPPFKISLKNAVDRYWSARGRNRVKFAFDCDFEKRFRLSCPDNARTHDFFSRDRLRRLLECADRFQIQSSPHWLVISRAGENITGRNLRQFLDATSKIAVCLLDSEPRERFLSLAG